MNCWKRASSSVILVFLLFSSGCARLSQSSASSRPDDSDRLALPRVEWVKYYEALGVHQKTNRRVAMLYFSHEPCKPCEMLEKWTFTDPRVVQAAAEFIPVKIDADVEVQMAERFRIQTYPMIVFARIDGGEIDRKAGYRDADFVLRWFKDIQADHNTMASVQKKLESNPDDVGLLLRQARNYLDADELEESVAFSARAAEIDPDNVDALILNGLHQLRLGKLDEAATAAAAAFLADESNEEARRLNVMIKLKQAENHLKAKDFAGAIEQYAKVLEIEPENFSAHMGLGHAQNEAGNTKKAFEEFQTAQAVRPLSSVPRVALGDLLEKEGNVAMAEEHYLAAIEMEPRYEPPYFRLMELYEKGGRRKELLDMFEKASFIEPAGAHNEIAWLLATSKHPDIFDPAAAETHARTAIELDPDSMYIDTLAEAYYAQGKHNLAIGVIKEAIAGDSEDLPYYQEQLEKFRQARDAALAGKKEG
jgi:tetratricopeptide (TPR) repeat protein